MADLYSLLMADEPTAAEQAAALQKALRRREAAGLVGQLTGDKVLGGVGQGLMAGAQRGEAGLLHAGEQRLQRQVQRERDAATDAYHKGMLGVAQQNAQTQEQYRRDQLAHQRAVLKAQYPGPMPQGAPAPVPAPHPGEAAGLKPQQFEGDVQQLGKDMEPISKIQPDLATLQSAAAKGNVAGFGPVAGLVPNFATSDEGVANRQAAGRIMAGIIQMISGQAASEKEVNRLLEANGLGRNATDAQIKEGVARLGGQYQDLVRQREAKYHPAVVDTYGQRGGFTSKAAPAAAGGGAVRKFTRGPDGKLVEVKP